MIARGTKVFTIIRSCLEEVVAVDRLKLHHGGSLVEAAVPVKRGRPEVVAAVRQPRAIKKRSWFPRVGEFRSGDQSHCLPVATPGGEGACSRTRQFRFSKSCFN
jgi:hypothetical protein